MRVLTYQFLILMFASIVHGQFSGDANAWVSCITNTISNKWCTNITNPEKSGKWWAKTDTDVGWSTNLTCSTDGATLLPMNSKFLLCPGDPLAWKTQNFFLYNKESNGNITSDFVRSKGEWWFKIIRWEASVKGVELYNFDFQNTTVEIYKDSTDKDVMFEFVASLNNTDTNWSKKINLSYQQAVYVLARSSDINYNGKIHFEYQAFQAAPFSPAIIVVIVVVAVVLLVLIGWAIKRWNKQRAETYQVDTMKLHQMKYNKINMSSMKIKDSSSDSNSLMEKESDPLIDR